jgi:hypothetical protein
MSANVVVTKNVGIQEITSDRRRDREALRRPHERPVPGLWA